jgi:hypothetical protein
VRERRGKSGAKSARRADRGFATAALAAVGGRLWSTAAHRPVDATAIVCAGAASLIIVVNAIFLQSGMHPAPFFADPTSLNSTALNSMASAPALGNRLAAPNAVTATSPASTAPTANPPATRTPDLGAEPPMPPPASARAAPPARTQASVAHRNDPIGDLIGTGGAPSSTSSVGSSRIIAIQRVLSEFGYGQLRPTGTLDEPTRAAIQKFEAEHQLPITGRLSDRLTTELAAMTGRPVQ